MKIAAIPLDIVDADPAENLKRVATILDKLEPDTDLAVLPELFSTGFIPDHEVMAPLAETTSGETLREIARLAAKHNFAIAGSYLHKAGTSLTNRAFLIEPCGEETFYDKRHLFCLSAEHTMAKQGTERPAVARFRGWNIGMIVCYDLRFPVWCRNYGLYYDIMLVPANWPQAREFAWKQLLSARSIENQACYVGADRGGRDRFGTYDGMNYACNAMGKSVGRFDEATGVLYAEFEKSSLDAVREKLPFATDADSFTINMD